MKNYKQYPTKTISKTKYLEFKSAPSPSGSDWCYVKRTNDTPSHDSAVVITTIVKIDNSYNFLLLKTRRPPLYAENKAEFCIESPAGLIGDINTNETLLECTKKELLEEAGLKTDKLYVELTNSSASSGLTSETLTYVTAIIDNPEFKESITDGGIIAKKFYVKVNDILNYIQNVDTKTTSFATATVTGIYFALNRLASSK